MHAMSQDPVPGLFDSAEQAFSRRDYRRAELQYSQFLLGEIARHARFDAAIAVAMHRAVEIQVLFGQLDSAANLLKGLHGELVKAGNTYFADLVQIEQATIHIKLGRFTAAQRLLEYLSSRPSNGELGSPLWESNWNWPDVTLPYRREIIARYYLAEGCLEATNGRYNTACGLYAAGARLAQVHGSPSLAPLLLAWADASLEKGDLVSARAALAAASDVRAVDEEPALRVERMELSAKADFLSGYYGSAKRSLERVVEFCRNGGFTRARLEASLNLAYALCLLNQTKDASDLCAEVRREGILLGEDGFRLRAEDLVRFAFERGQALATSVSSGASTSDLWNTLPAFPSQGGMQFNEDSIDLPAPANYLAFFEHRTLEFFRLLGQERFDSASECLAEIDRTFRSCDSLLVQVRLAALDATLAYYYDQYPQALRCFEACAEQLRRMGLKPELLQALRFVEWCRLRMGMGDAARRAWREIQELEQDIAGTLSGADRAIYLLNKWTETERYMAGEIAELVKLKESTKSPGLGHLFGRWWGRFRIAFRLASLLSYADQYKGLPDGREQTRKWQRLPPRIVLRHLLLHDRRSTTLSFIVLPDVVLIARTGFLRLDFEVSPVTRPQLRAWVRQYHEATRDIVTDCDRPELPIEERLALASSRRRAGNARREAARLLASRLRLSELTGTLPSRIRHIRVLPDDVLFGVPFAAFPCEGHRYMIERFAVSLAYEWAPPKRSSTPKGPFIAVCAAGESPGLPALAGAEAERLRVKEWLTGFGVPQIEVQPTRVDLLRRMPEAWLWHAAAHGEFHSDRPDASGLLFPCGQTVETLTIRDLSGLDLNRMEQAILSSCWSADNFVLPGRWIISLPETLCARASGRSSVGCGS